MTEDTVGRDKTNKQQEQKKQATDQEKVFAIYIAVQIVIYTNDLYITKQKISNPLETWIRVIKWQFTEEEIYTANKHLKTCTTAVVIRKCKLKPFHTHELGKNLNAESSCSHEFFHSNMVVFAKIKNVFPNKIAIVQLDLFLKNFSFINTRTLI